MNIALTAAQVDLGASDVSHQWICDKHLPAAGIMRHAIATDLAPGAPVEATAVTTSGVE